MKINLITQEEYNKLLDIYNQYPNLTLQNKGYEYINKTNFTKDEWLKQEEVENILKVSIFGFKNFSNFRLTSIGEIQLRIQYDYNYGVGNSFTGVGYVLLDNLLNGF